MIAINVIDDRFKESQSNQADFAKGSLGVLSRDAKTVRRPTRGIAIKEDTFATLRVITGDGTNLPIVDAGGKHGSRTHRTTQVYSNFLLQQVNEERVEKQQILETFGEPYIFLFGERARMVSFAGVLINTFDFNWEAEWWDNYENLLRGTKCVENDARVFIAYDETLVSGYIIASSASKNSNDKNHVNFQFTMFITGYTNFSAIGDGTAIPLRQQELAQKSATVQSGNASIDFSVQGPNIILSGQVLTGAVDATGAVEQPSLVDGLQNGLSTVLNAWDKASSLVNSATIALANLAQGEVLRVPVGFTGAIAYDSASVVRVQSDPTTNSGLYGTLTYSEFRDNTDEYVGSSSHYGDSQNISPPTVDSSFFQQQQLTKNQELMDDLQTQWLESGFALPPEEVPGVAGFILNAGAGLVAAGNTAAWQAQQLQNTGQGVANLNPTTAARNASPVPVPF